MQYIVVRKVDIKLLGTRCQHISVANNGDVGGYFMLREQHTNIRANASRFAAGDSYAG